MLWRRVITVSLYVALVLLLVVLPLSGGRKRGKRPRVPCPSSSCKCRWGRGLFGGERQSVRVMCPAVSERVPSFSQTDVVYGTFSLIQKNISHLARNSFINVQTKLLDLSGNLLDTENCVEPGAFNGLEDILEVLLLRANGLPYIPGDISKLSQLRFLQLEDNNISHIDATTFSNNSQLEELMLYNNRISEVDPQLFVNLVYLKHLSLMGNNLDHIPDNLFRKNKKLRILDLSENRLSVLPRGIFRGLGKLKELELQKNKISVINKNMFRGLRRLRNLKIEENPLRHIRDKTFKWINKLTYLSLDIINVEELNPKIFKGLHRLKMFVMGEVDTNSLPASIFAPLSNIERMTMFNMTEKFESLSENVFPPDMDVSGLKIWIGPTSSCKCNVPWINAMTSRGVWIKGQCGESMRRLSCIVPGKRKDSKKRKHKSDFY